MKACIAAVTLIAGTSAAFADTVDVSFQGVGQGRVVHYSLNGSGRNVFAGQLLHNFSNGTGIGAELSGDILTYCTDLLEHVSRSTNQFDVVAPEDAPAVPMGIVKANALRDLYTFAGGAQNSIGADRDFAAAFQIAIWEVVADYDGNVGRSSLAVDNGSFEARRTNGASLSGAIMGHLNSLFDAIGMVGARSDGRRLFAVKNDGKQDQLVELAVVPLPSAAGLGFAGLCGMAGIRRRR